MNKNDATPTSPSGRRRWFLAGAAGMCLGAGLTILIQFCFGEKDLPTLAPFRSAGRLPALEPANDPDAAKKDAAARGLAEKALDSVTKRDADGLASLCATPFLGGDLGKSRLIRNRPDLTKSLSDGLCHSRGYGEFMFERKWDIGAALTPDRFFEEYSDYLAGSPTTRKGLAALELGPADRLVVENGRGMLMIVRTAGDETRLIGIVPVGFRPREFKLTREVIYGRKYGAALTLDILQPARNGNRAAVLELISDSFVSHPPVIGHGSLCAQELVGAGYTVIYVTHSGAPKHTIPEALCDVHRAVRFVRYHTGRLNLDADRIAIMGRSAGGYLALMVGADDGKGYPFPPESDPTRMAVENDPVEAVSGGVQAVVSYSAPTDWLNYGAEGKSVFDHPMAAKYRGIFDLYEFDDTRAGFNKITDQARITRELTNLSPASRMSRHAAPTLLFHGDSDSNVPIQQSERIVDMLKKAGVPAKLVVKAGAGHGWADNEEDTAAIVAWLNRYLLKME